MLRALCARHQTKFSASGASTMMRYCLLLLSITLFSEQIASGRTKRFMGRRVLFTRSTCCGGNYNGCGGNTSAVLEYKGQRLQTDRGGDPLKVTVPVAAEDVHVKYLNLRLNLNSVSCALSLKKTHGSWPTQLVIVVPNWTYTVDKVTSESSPLISSILHVRGDDSLIISVAFESRTPSPAQIDLHISGIWTEPGPPPFVDAGGAYRR